MDHINATSESTRAVINLVAIVSGRRDPELLTVTARSRPISSRSVLFIGVSDVAITATKPTSVKLLYPEAAIANQGISKVMHPLPDSGITEIRPTTDSPPSARLIGIPPKEE
jgi:hypothetical protein